MGPGRRQHNLSRKWLPNRILGYTDPPINSVQYSSCLFILANRESIRKWYKVAIALVYRCRRWSPGFHPEGIILGGGGGGGGSARNGCGFIYLSIQLSQIWGGGGQGKLPPG